jgi:hypothetical protein
MQVGRYFRVGSNNWEYELRNIPSTYKEQKAFYEGALPPREALPQASDEDIRFLIEGCCFDPTVEP